MARIKGTLVLLAAAASIAGCSALAERIPAQTVLVGGTPVTVTGGVASAGIGF